MLYFGAQYDLVVDTAQSPAGAVGNNKERTTTPEKMNAASGGKIINPAYSVLQTKIYDSEFGALFHRHL